MGVIETHEIYVLLRRSRGWWMRGSKSTQGSPVSYSISSAILRVLACPLTGRIGVRQLCFFVGMLSGLIVFMRCLLSGIVVALLEMAHGRRLDLQLYVF